MPFELVHILEENYVHIKVHGDFSANQYDTIMNQVVKNDEISKHAHTLWDLREMDFTNIHKDFLTDILAHRKRYDAKRGKNTKAAIVANSDLGFGISRQYEALSFEFSQKMQIFRTIDDAKSWLNE